MMRARSLLKIIAKLCMLLQLASGKAKEQPGDLSDKKPYAEVSPTKSIVYGPALNPRIVTPARYLFIQAVDENGKNFTRSAGDVFKCSIYLDHEGGRSRLKTDLSDRGDGTYQISFFYGIQPTQILILVQMTDGRYVGGDGPITIKDAEVEQCYCPRTDPDAWSADYGCPSHEPQVDKDLDTFPAIDKALLNRTLAALQSRGACFVHYAIRRNRIHGRAYGRWQGFKQYSDDMLLSLARRVRLPDAEFFMNLGDWPLANGTERGLPVFSWCGSRGSDDIVVPTYKMTLGTVFGRDFENVRDVDAKNHMDYYPSEEERRADKRLQAGGKVPRMPFMHFWKYRYLLSIDGTVAAYRLPSLLAGDSVIFKPASDYYEHFYGELVPWEHYIPVAADLGDVIARLDWADAHGAAARNIARAARAFARRRLTAEAVYCYYYRALKEYAARLTFKVRVPPGYEEARQPVPTAKCRCSQAPAAAASPANEPPAPPAPPAPQPPKAEL